MSRSNARSRRLRSRPSRTVAATIVSVVLLALGVLTAVVAVYRLLDDRWPAQVTGPSRVVGGLTWGSNAVIAAGVIAALLGLAMLVAGIKRGAFQTAQLRAAGDSRPGTSTDFVISTRGMARLAVGRADQVDGVDKVSASASGRRVHLAIVTSSEQAVQIGDRVRAGVTETLSAAGVQPLPRVTTRVRTRGL